MELPDINPDKITSLTACKDALKQVLNLCEALLHERKQFLKKITLLEKEIARLKKQPKKPQFSATSYAAPKQTEKQGKAWQKGKRGKIEIDHHAALPETARCSCGSTGLKQSAQQQRSFRGWQSPGIIPPIMGEEKSVPHVEKYMLQKFPTE